MGRINVLDKRMAELIAAGEVIDRPASVVKELVENSIDAGASKITVELRQGGIGYMRVTDDGAGIAPDDIAKAFLRHATSKLKEPEDLNHILTMGFRGEALASIAAMCRVEVLSRTADAAEGVRYRIEGGEEIENAPAGCPQGTSILVRDIFYNTPARMKFLKKDVTEGGAVGAVLDRMALACPAVAFRLVREGKTVMQTPGNGRLADAVYAVYGREFYNTLLPVDHIHQGIRISGYISRPTDSRGSRSMQVFFVNARYVRSKTCVAALEEGYRTCLMKGKFPAGILNVQLPPSVFDINVHPAKLEVRFADEKPVFDSIYYAVKSALSALDGQGAPVPVRALRPQAAQLELHQDAFLSEEIQRLDAAAYRRLVGLPAGGQASPGQPARQGVQGRDGGRPVSPLASPLELSPAKGKQAAARLARRLYTPVKPADTTCAPLSSPGEISSGPAGRCGADSPAFSGKTGLPSGNGTAGPCGNLPCPATDEAAGLPASPCPATRQASNVLAENAARPGTATAAQEAARGEEGAISIETAPAPRRYDNARLVGELFKTYILLEADDRMILIDKHAAHERLLYEQLRAGSETRRQLLIDPVAVTLQRDEYTALMQNLPLLGQMGFGVEDFGGATVLVREIPTQLGLEQTEKSICEIAAQLALGGGTPSVSALEDLYHTLACKAAIKAHDDTSPQELQALIELLNEQDDVRFCPHGRPIATVLTRAQLERMFGRS